MINERIKSRRNFLQRKTKVLRRKKNREKEATTSDLGTERERERERERCGA
jgi:hypothetical protein